VELFNDDAELLLLQFIDNHPENMHIKHVYFQLGKFQYRKKAYQRALNSFEEVDVLDLPKDEQIEFYFKRGYSYFKNDSINFAKKNFFEVINKESKYQPPALYYYSHIAYEEGNYETALKGFLTLTDDEAFKPVIPYYVTHIYYMQKRYDELLSVAPDLLENSTPKRKPEIARLIGEAYYRQDNYLAAIPYLQQYHGAVGQAPSQNNLYQMAYAYFKTDAYDLAIPYFQKVTDTTENLSQSANYHLAICYIFTDKKTYALTAFQNAYQQGIDEDIKADALYNFAKLSYELDYNPYNQALKAFETFVTEYPNSQHRVEAMSYLTKMYLSTNNYEQALKSIEKIEDMSPELQLAYQRILFSVAIQSFKQRKWEHAIDYFDKSIALNRAKNYTAKSYFWKAETYYQTGDYAMAIRVYNQFLVANGAFLEPNYNEAHYNLGYAYFQVKNYSEANKEFRIFILNIEDGKSLIANDAYNRIGESYFIQSEFQLAVESYNQALIIAKRDVDYSLYKKAEALGALGRHQEKAQAFEQLIAQHPQSNYAGNAEYALAQIYNKVLNNNELAIKHYLNVINTYPMQTSYVKKAKLDLGYLYNNTDRRKEGIAILKQVYEDYKGTAESKDALTTLQGIYTEMGEVNDFFNWVKGQGIEISVSVQDSANYFVAENLYMQSKCNEAVASFSDYIQRFPGGFFTNKAYFYKAECERKLKNYIEALKDYQFVVDQPISAYSEKAIQWISHINYDLLKDYPASRKAFHSLQRLSESKENYQMALVGIMRCDWFSESYDSLLISAAKVRRMDDLPVEIYTESMLYSMRVLVERKNWIEALPILESLTLKRGSIEAAEAMYYLAQDAFEKQLYDSAEAITYTIIQQEPSFEIWVVKSFILSADIFMATGNLHQAKATLTSIVENYEGDQKILDEAKEKLQKVNVLSAKPKPAIEPAEMIIDLGTDKSLFEQRRDQENIQEEWEEID
jgi:tetratricopeptide (TPR) repeat protein